MHSSANHPKPAVVCHSFDERVDRQPVDVDRPVWPPSTLPLFATMQPRRDIDILPRRIEARFVQINLGHLS
jgi:hypothetical protein